MKCRIKISGEIVDVIGWSFDGSWTHYVDINGIDTTAGLDYYKDFEPIVEDNIDWEHRRYEIAKAASNGMLSNSENFMDNDTIIYESILFADKLIKQLKAKQNEI